MTTAIAIISRNYFAVPAVVGYPKDDTRLTVSEIDIADFVDLIGGIVITAATAHRGKRQENKKQTFHNQEFIFYKDNVFRQTGNIFPQKIFFNDFKVIKVIKVSFPPKKVPPPARKPAGEQSLLRQTVI